MPLTTFLETTPAFVRQLDLDESMDFTDTPKATRATLELWYSTFGEGERQAFEQEILTHQHGTFFFWQTLHSIFRQRITPAQWVEKIQKNDWHLAKRMRERRAKN